MEEKKNVTPRPTGARPVPPPPPRPQPPVRPAAPTATKSAPKTTTVSRPAANTAKPQANAEEPKATVSRVKNDEVRQLERENDKRLEAEVKQEVENRGKTKGSPASIFYWIGFIACLLGIGVMVFLLIM